MITDLLVIIFLLMLSYYWFLNRSIYIKMLSKIPGLKGTNLPILGNLLDIQLNFNDIFKWCLRSVDAGGITLAWLPGQAYILISNANYANLILKSTTFIPKGDYYSFVKDWISLGFANGRRLNRETNKMRRKTYFPLLQSSSVMQEVIHFFNKNSLLMVDRLTNANTEDGVNIYKFATDCSFDIIFETILGVPGTAQAVEGSCYQTAVNELLYVSMIRYLNPWLRPNWIWRFSPLKKRYEKSLNVVTEFCKQIFFQRKQEIEQRKNGGEEFTTKCILDKMILLDYSNGFTEFEENLRIINGFIFAGYDTSSSVTGWFLGAMGTYPDIQDKVVEELVSVFGDSGRLPDIKDLDNLKYLDMCIKETMRLFPPGPVIERKSENYLEIGKYTIPANTNIILFIYGIHRNPAYYPDPDKFIPERFSAENSKNIPPGAFIPFSGGDQSCVGKNFAMLEIKCILSNVLRRYRIESLKNVHDIEFCTRTILQPKGGLYIRAFERNSHPYLRAQLL